VPRLLVTKGADEGKQFELADALITVGRDGTNRIRLHDTEVSRRHAEFRQVEAGYAVMDVGSANGTFVNNQKIQEAVLQAGDQIVFGQTTLVYSTGRGDDRLDQAGLAEKISMISRHDLELSSAIINRIGETEGSRILAQPEKTSPWLKTALANLTIMYEASQAVSHILDLNELLDRILELVFRSIEADRGCIMLRHPEIAQLEPKALRRRKEGVSGEKFAVSRTIMDHVLAAKEGVLVSDAARDERFNTGESIVRFGIREVICVPMRGRHETLGVLYLDTHTGAREAAGRKSGIGKFTEDHLALAIAVAHQAALAVEETRYHQAMVQAERLAAIGQTIAALSHHIKNILQGLRSGSEILKMGLKDKNDTLVQQGWRIAEKNQGKIYDLVMDMLSYSKEREPAVEPTDLNQVVRDVVELMDGKAKELGVHLEVNLEASLPVIQVDPEGIHRALLNIVTNALEALEGRPEPKVTVGTRVSLDEGWARLIVIDNGTGIDAAKLADIFKPFVSTKGAKGTGLGLAVSRKILREHGGDILVESKLGVGSKFTLRLPLKSPLSSDPNSTSAEMPILPPEAD
jgi:signal transduction histidine kinase